MLEQVNKKFEKNIEGVAGASSGSSIESSSTEETPFSNHVVMSSWSLDGKRRSKNKIKAVMRSDLNEGEEFTWTEDGETDLHSSEIKKIKVLQDGLLSVQTENAVFIIGRKLEAPTDNQTGVREQDETSGIPGLPDYSKTMEKIDLNIDSSVLNVDRSVLDIDQDTVSDLTTVDKNSERVENKLPLSVRADEMINMVEENGMFVSEEAEHEPAAISVNPARAERQEEDERNKKEELLDEKVANALNEDPFLNLNEKESTPISINPARAEQQEEQGKSGELIEDKEQPSEQLVHPERSDEEKYLEYKKEFRAAEKAYHQVLRDNLNWRQVFGFKRSVLHKHPEVKEAHQAYINANQRYIDFARESGVYDKLRERLGERMGAEVSESAFQRQLFERHVLTPAEKRLNEQTLSGKSEYIRELFKRSKKHKGFLKATGLAMLAGGVWFATPAVAAGFLVRLAGNKFVVKGAERTKSDASAEAEAAFQSNEISLEDIEASAMVDYATAAASARKQRLLTNSAAAVVGASAGTAYWEHSAHNYMQTPEGEALVGEVSEWAGAAKDKVAEFINPETQHPETSGVIRESTPSLADLMDPQEVVMSNGNEALSDMPVHEVVTGDNTSTILSNALRQQVESGNFVLPAGNDASHYLYQQVPELTNADIGDAGGRFSPDQWREWGIASGDPQNITPTDTIDVAKIIEALQPDSAIEVSTENIEPLAADAELSNVASQPDAAFEPLPENVPAYQEDVISEISSGSVADAELPDADLAAAKESLATTMKRFVSEKAVMGNNFDDLRSGLANSLLAEMETGTYTLPAEVMVKLQQDPGFMHTLVDRAFPELAPQTQNGFIEAIAGSANDTLSADQWGADLDKIPKGSKINLGELKRIVLEDIAQDYQYHGNDVLLQAAAENKLSSGKTIIELSARDNFVPDNLPARSIDSVETETLSPEEKAKVIQDEIDRRDAMVIEMAKRDGIEIETERIKGQSPSTSEQPSSNVPTEQPAGNNEQNPPEEKSGITKEDVRDAARKARQLKNNPTRTIINETADQIEQTTGIPKSESRRILRDIWREIK